MKEIIELVLQSYIEARSQSIIKHPIAEILRINIPELIRSQIFDNQRYIVKGSAGQGNWTTIPWIAIFDVLVTQTAQSGFYPVYLFKEDMSGLYLSLNQGVTTIQDKYQRKASEVLRIKSEDYRAQLYKRSSNFNIDSIKLVDSKSGVSKLGELYESGNILAKFYDAQSIPDNSVLYSDIREMLEIYRSLTFNESLPTNNSEAEEIEQSFTGVEKLKKFKFHKRIERNSQLVKLVKKVQGYTCKACGFNYVDKYGDLGKDFIEAHHLTPVSKLTGTAVELDARKDFVVLCSNCHKMIHRLEDPSDINLLISLIKPTMII